VEPEILVESRDGVLLITMNRPEKRNAINRALADGLLDAIQTLDEDPSLLAGVLAGNGPAFSAGMDLRAFGADGPPEALATFVRRGSRKPMIAAIEGAAYAGGLELALTCDVVIASPVAAFAIPEAKVGLIAAAGGILRLPRRMHYGLAMEMALTGDPISAEEARDAGLVSRLVREGEAVAASIELASRIARNSPRAVAASKSLIRDAAGLTEREYWRVQKPIIEELLTSHDAREGARAFIEKRSPQWEAL
jgi:enoyl-CoA hydratase/carnithine racemase